MNTQTYNIHDYNQTLMYIKNNMNDISYYEMNKILAKYPNIMVDFIDPKKKALRDLRVTALSTVKHIVDDPHEDKCYELAYNLHPSIARDIISYIGFLDETSVLKTILKDRVIYNNLLQLNNSMFEKDRLQEMMMQMKSQAYQYVTEHSNKILNEYYRQKMALMGVRY
jgi:hypothetical protein